MITVGEIRKLIQGIAPDRLLTVENGKLYLTPPKDKQRKSRSPNYNRRVDPEKVIGMHNLGRKRKDIAKIFKVSVQYINKIICDHIKESK